MYIEYKWIKPIKIIDSYTYINKYRKFHTTSIQTTRIFSMEFRMLQVANGSLLFLRPSRSPHLF